MSLFGKLIHRLSERQASRATNAELIEQMQESADVVTERFAVAADTPDNREAACHIIGIERWGDRRLRTALGEPPIRDEYDGYRPSLDLDMVTLAGEFAETRQQTLALAQWAADLPDSVTVAHNELGDLTVGGWLVYLNDHANRESRFRLRG